MKKIITILSTVALVAMGAMTISCDKMKNDNGPRINPDGSITYTTTLHMGADTKTVIGEDGTHTFKVGDQIAVAYLNNRDVQVKAVSNALTEDDIDILDKSARFTVTLTDAPHEFKGNYVYYIYPASMTTANGGIDYTNLNAQDGTLASLASNLDCCYAYAVWNGSDELPTRTLTNMITIGKFTIKNPSGTAINDDLTSVTISDGSNTYVITPAGASTFTSDPIWVAMKPIYEGTGVTVTATDGTDNYTKTVTIASGEDLNAGMITPINVTMTKFAATLSASVVGDIVGSDGLAYDVADINNLPTGVTALAMVAYKNGSNGLAISLTDINTYELNYAQATGDYGIPAWSASRPIVGGSWRIPTEQDWQRMMWGYYVGNPVATNISAFQALLGAYGLVANGYYWTGSEVDTYNARAILYDGTYAGIINAGKSEYFHVRACLAF